MTYPTQLQQVRYLLLTHSAPLTVVEIMGKLNLNRPTVTNQLATLKNEGVIKAMKLQGHASKIYCPVKLEGTVARRQWLEAQRKQKKSLEGANSIYNLSLQLYKGALSANPR